jgi:hypothetical protein
MGLYLPTSASVEDKEAVSMVVSFMTTNNNIEEEVQETVPKEGKRLSTRDH